jgi:AP-2 complex subunit sigma-1
VLACVPQKAPAQYRTWKIVYRRYAGLFFGICVDANDNELAYLEAIHLFVEVLGVPTCCYDESWADLPRLADAFFGNV